MSSSDHCPQFNPEQETIDEFIERFEVLNLERLEAAGNNEKKRAAVLIKALPVSVITDLQRCIKPIKLSQLAEKKTNFSICNKKSISPILKQKTKGW